MSHFDQCKLRVTKYAEGLIEAVRRGGMNASAYEGLIDSYLDQPAYWPHDRTKLRQHALDLFDRR